MPTSGLDGSSTSPYPTSEIATESAFNEASGCKTATIVFVVRQNGGKSIYQNLIVSLLPFRFAYQNCLG